jgi:hypothetical protein
MKKFPVSYGTGRFIKVLTRIPAAHILNQMNPALTL